MRVRALVLGAFLAACSDNEAPSDPCAGVDACPLSVNALLWCRGADHPECNDTLRAWVACFRDNCHADAQVDADGGAEGPCYALGAAHAECRRR